MQKECSLGQWVWSASASRRWSDVQIQAAGRQYRAHRLVLSCASPFIRGLLLSIPSDDLPTTIVLADVASEIVEAFLQYVYTGEVSLLPEHLESFLALTQTLQVHVEKTDIDGLKKISMDKFPSESKKLQTNKTSSDKSSVLLNILNEFTSKNENETKSSVDIKDPGVCDIKFEGCEKNMDIEVLIKSDKISKKSAIILPEIKECVMKTNCDKTLYDNYPNIFLKNILNTNNDKLITPRTHTLLDNFQTNENREESDRNSNTLKEVYTDKMCNLNKSECIDVDNCSSSSCEILEPVCERKSPEASYISSLSNIQNKILRGSDENPCYGKPHNLVTNQNIVALNLVNNKRSIEKDGIRSTFSSYIHPTFQKSLYNELSKNSLSLPISKSLTSVENKLVRPIPSLMPLETCISESHQKKSYIDNTSSNLLDLSSFSNSHFNRTNSAFEEVKNYSEQYEERQYLNHGPRFHNGLLRHHINYLQSQKSLRLGFNIIQRDKTIDNNLNMFHNQNSFVEDTYAGNSASVTVINGLKKNKVLPHNKVMISPWGTRRPVYYRPEKKIQIRYDHQPQEPNYQSISSVSSPYNKFAEILTKRGESTDYKIGLNSYRNYEELPNDSNNNFNISDGNNIPATNACTYYESVHDKEFQQTTTLYNKVIISKDTESLSNLIPKAKDINFGDKEYTNRDRDNITPIKEILSPQKTKFDDPIETCLEENVINPKLDSNFVKLESHLLTPPDDVLKCEACSLVFTSREALVLHSSTHATRARYKCEQCNKCFSQLRNYKYHVSVHRGTKEFAATCNVCGKYFNDRGYLSSHMKIHRNRKEYQCPHCPKSFNQRVAYNMHVRIHTGIKPHQCEECGKAFSRKMLLKQHARTHSGEKPYACAACGKRFADRSNMTLHMRLHSGVKPFSCTLCPKSFTKKHHLKTHLNYHTGNKPYACVKCGLTFSQSSNMRTHMKKCSAPEPSAASPTKFLDISTLNQQPSERNLAS